MKVLFSLYYENYSAQERTIYFSKWVETDWAYTKIEQYLNIKDGFHSQCIIGNNLSFWDIYSFYDDIESIAKEILLIRSGELIAKGTVEQLTTQVHYGEHTLENLYLQYYGGDAK